MATFWSKYTSFGKSQRKNSFKLRVNFFQPCNLEVDMWAFTLPHDPRGLSGEMFL